MENLKISNDLLNEVIGKKVIYRGFLDNFKPCCLEYIEDLTNVESVNIYELAHKCKEWLLDNGYYIKISPFKVELFEKDTNCFMRDFYSPIQSGSIPYDIKREIQAYQWILDIKES